VTRPVTVHKAIKRYLLLWGADPQGFNNSPQSAANSQQPTAYGLQPVFMDFGSQQQY